MIKMLNLYRCYSVEPRITEKNVTHFVTDYFDAFKVEDLNDGDGDQPVTLAECFGIKDNEEIRKRGISYQRYCLYSEDESKEFPGSADGYAVLTVIQVFINPNLYQAQGFLGEGGVGSDRISCEACIQRVRECISEAAQGRESLKWEVFRLLTEGDFAVVVWSRTFREAYDIIMVIRSIRFTPEAGVNEPAFSSYSIAGILDNQLCEDGDEDRIKNTAAAGCLENGDSVAVRIECSPLFYTGEKTDGDQGLINAFLQMGSRLFGRYDYQVTFTAQEFAELYPYVRAFKFCDRKVTKEMASSVSSDKVGLFLQMMERGYVSFINEKVLLGDRDAANLAVRHPETWKVNVPEGEWKPLLERNREIIDKGKERVETIKERLRGYCQSARNLQEYTRLLGRLYRVLYEMNQMHELQVSVANLAAQALTMVESLLRYLDAMESHKCQRKEIADSVEEYLRHGISALEIFTRYVRNINLQTLQAPNYDLQTNVCVEKILLAYSQFLRPFMRQEQDEDRAGYCLWNTLYPIVVPNTSMKDLSVCRLFDNPFKEEGRDERNLMVVSTPTFSFLCETCFMVPALFHEIAHQYRYERRETRNKCLFRMILKSVAHDFLLELLDEERAFRFMAADGMEGLVDRIYLCLENAIWGKIDGTRSLRYFRVDLKRELLAFARESQALDDPYGEALREYIKDTKEYIPYGDSALLETLDGLHAAGFQDGQRQNEAAAEKDEMTRLNDCLGSLERIYLLQIRAAENEEGETGQKRVSFITKKKDACEYRLRSSFGASQAGAIDAFTQICKTIYDETLSKLEEFAGSGENAAGHMEAVGMTDGDLERTRKKIKYGGEEGTRKRFAAYLLRSRQGLMELVDASIELYREVTSDLFMCSIMDLTAWGYLVVAAEMFVFREDNKKELYRRVGMVTRCLISSKPGEVLEAEAYEQRMGQIVCEAAQLLFDQMGEGCVCGSDGAGWPEVDLALAHLKEIHGRKYQGLNTTQKWILRIYEQGISIVRNLRYAYNPGIDVEEKEVWRDISGEKSFLWQREKLRGKLDAYGGSELCDGISSILNSPASFFRRRKSLLDGEIRFILQQYEENCKSIFGIQGGA